MSTNYWKIGGDMFGLKEDVIKQIIGWVATAATLYLFLAPVPAMRRIFREKSTLDFADAPYVIGLVNCLLWVAYCFFIGVGERVQPFATNTFGCLAQGAYACCFLWFHPPNKRLWLFGRLAVAVVAFVAAVAVAAALGAGDNMKSATTLGIFADVLNGMMYASPLAVIGLVCRTKSVEFMPLGLSIGTLITSIMWALFALWVGDLYIAVPNNAGVVLGFVQLGVYAKFAGSARETAGRLLDGSDVCPTVEVPVAKDAV